MPEHLVPGARFLSVRFICVRFLSAVFAHISLHISLAGPALVGYVREDSLSFVGMCAMPRFTCAVQFAIAEDPHM